MPTTELEVRLRTRHPSQARIVAESQRFNVLQCGRRFGKTSLGVDLAVEAMLDGSPVGWFAPTYKILDEAMRDVLRAVREALTVEDKQQRRYELVTGGSIEFWSTDTPDPGRSRKYGRVIVDEGGMIRDLEAVWTESIRATLTDLKGDAWFFGTPKGKNYFHSLYVRGQKQDKPGWMSWRFATVDNPFLDASEIAEAQNELPELAFRQEYLGEAVDDGTNPFGLDFIARAIIPALSPEPAVCYGVDLAKSVDFTVSLGLDRAGWACSFDRFQSPWQETFDRVKRTVGTTPALVDSTGVGDAIVERFTREGGPNYEGFKFTQQSRQQLLEGLAAAIQKGEVKFPDGPIRLELESFGYEYTRTGGVRYCAPDALHDDCVMALALAVRKHSVPPLPELEIW